MKTTPFNQTIRSGLLLLTFGVLSTPLQKAMAADGTWIGSTSNVLPNGAYSLSTNWAGGIVASGTDATATFVYNPTSDAGGTGQLAGGLIFDASQTVGNLVFEDLDGYGSATIGFNQATANTPLNLTLDTTSGVPTITTGQVLNGISGGKKVVINHNILGADGLTTNGPGFLGLRGSLGGASTLSGPLNVDGGILQIQSLLGNITSTTVRNGSTLFLDFSTSGAAGTNRINAASTLTLGGTGGSGVVANANAAATATHSQNFAGVTLNAGAHQVIANTNTNQNMTYNLGAIVNTGMAALNLAKPTAAGTGGITLTNTNNASGIIGGWATYNGADWAINNGSGTAAAYTAYAADTWAAGNNTNVNKSVNLSGATTGSLRLNNGTATITTLSGVNTLSSGGLISAQQSPIITGGTLTSGTTDLITHVAGGTLRVQSTIADGSAGATTLVKALTGTLQLENNMTYTGGTVLGAGTITLGKGPLGGSSGALGSGTVILSANNTGTGSYSPSGVLAFNRSGTTTVTQSINPTVNAGGYLAQVSGGGTLVLNKAMKLGGYIQQAGTTRLDFSALGAPETQIIDGSITTGPTTLQTGRLQLRNGTIEMIGGLEAPNVQSFALTEIQGGVKIKLTPGIGGTTEIQLGAINHVINSADGGGSLMLTLPAGASAAMNSGTAGTIISNAGNAYVTVNGNEWGAKDATNTKIVAGGTLPGFYTATTGGGLVAATNTDVTTSDSVTGAIQLNSLRFDTAAANTITVNAAGTLRPAGILVSNNVGANVTTIAGTGDLRSATGNRDLPIFQNNTRASLVVSAPIVNFDATNLTHLVKSGAGEVELTSSGNTYTGRTFVNEGTLRLSGTAALGTAAARTGSIFGRGGEIIVQDSAKVYTGSYASMGQRQGEDGTLTVKNSGLFDISADFNIGDVNAKGTLNISDTASLVVKNLFVGKGGYSEGTVNQTGGTLATGNTPSADWNIGGNGAGDTGAIGIYNISGGTLNTGAQNFQTGRWGTGTLNISGTGAVTGTAFHVVGRFHTGVGTVNLSGGAYTASTANYFIVGEEGTGTLNVSGTGVLTAKNLSLAHNGGKGTVVQTGGTVDLQSTAAIGAINAGVVFGATNAPGRLVPDYSGTYTLSGGLLKTFGIRENPGATTPINSTFNFDGGTVQAIGNNATFMDNLDLAAVKAGGAKIDTNTFSVTVAQALQHDTALGATPDGGLTKNGLGTLTLTGASTYTGPTSVNAGTLLVNGNNSAATGPISVAGSAVFGGSGIVGGPLTMAAGSTFAPGTSPNTLTTTSSATFAATTSLAYELNGANQTAGGGVNDLFTGITILTLDGVLNVTETVAGSFASVTSGSWRLMDYTVSLTDNGLTIGSAPALPAGYSFQVDTSTPNQVNLVVVPEPGITGLLGSLLAAAGLRRRRRSA